MPRKNSDKKPAVPLRRSPRFLQVVLADPEDPRTPKLEPQRRNRVPSSATPVSFTGKVKVSPGWRSLRSNSKSCPQTHDESCNVTQRSDNLKSRSRKSTRLTPCAEECTGEKVSRSSKWRNRELEKRTTRSSCSRNVDTNAKKTGNVGITGNTGDDCSLTEQGVKLSSKQSKDKLPKNKVKNSKKSQENNLASDDNTNKGALSITETQITTLNIAHDEPTNIRNIDNKIQKNIGEKRKRNQLQGIAGVAHGWTKDQESALERAYLVAKPTPHFWKKVSRLVPGKSAQECFDKVHGSHLTPPPPRLRTRARIPKSNDPTLSASKLLSSSPTTKKPKSRKQKSHVIQRTVRHMLQNQCKEQDSEADMFSVLEPTFTQSSNHLMITTPVRNLDMEGVLKRSSSTAHKKSLSRFSGATLVSPPVLKQVKNKALHEKYIDQLHCREACRKVASKKAGKCNGSEGAKGESSLERKGAIKAAKNALVFGAKDAINEFEFKQGMALIDVFEDEFVGGDTDDEDDDGGQVLV